jgi:alkylation response protein AidB-like acyl-CoA dehydrogenase
MSPKAVRTPRGAPVVATVDRLIAWVRDYARERINFRIADDRRAIPPHVVLDLGNRGLLGMQTSTEYGGLGLTNREAVRVADALGAIDLTLAVFVGNNNSLGIRPIERFARASLKARLLGTLASGRALAAFALTEAGAGSNPRAIATTATLDRDGRFRIRGTKIWSGSSSWAGVINVFAQTHRTDGERVGITGFAIEQGRPGIAIGAEALTLGMRGMVQNSVTFDDVCIEPEEVLGEVGGGLEVANEAMTFCRLGLAAIAVGGMRRCVQLLQRYAARRSIGTGSLLDNPVTKLRLAEMSAKALALRHLVDDVATRLDMGEEVPSEVFCACKALGPEFLWQGADWLVQGLGGRGYMENNPAPRILRDARVFRVFEGPTETIQMFLGSRLLAARGSSQTIAAATGGDVAIGDRLAAVAARVRSSGLTGPFTKRISNSEWNSYRLGEIYSWGVLAASVRRGCATSSGELERSLVRWVEQEFEERCAAVLAPGRGVEELLSAPFAEAVLAGVDEADQSLPGEEVDLDPLLREEATVTGGPRSRL